MSKSKYTKMSSAPTARILRWDVPARHQGQIVEHAFSAFGRGEADEGDAYMRITDKSLPPGAHGRVEYYSLVED